LNALQNLNVDTHHKRVSYCGQVCSNCQYSRDHCISCYQAHSVWIAIQDSALIFASLSPFGACDSCPHQRQDGISYPSLWIYDALHHIPPACQGAGLIHYCDVSALYSLLH
jgi:hypothetical protein